MSPLELTLGLTIIVVSLIMIYTYIRTLIEEKNMNKAQVSRITSHLIKERQNSTQFAKSLKNGVFYDIKNNSLVLMENLVKVGDIDND